MLRTCRALLLHVAVGLLYMTAGSAHARPPAGAPPPTPTPARPEPPPADDESPADDGGNSPAGFLDFNVYPYLGEVDSDSVFTINAFAKLPYGFSYFALLNINNKSNAKALADTDGYYTEQNLRWTPVEQVPIDLTLQYNLRSGPDNDRLRLGLRVRFEGVPFLGELLKAIHLAYSLNFHALQLDHEHAYVMQLEHVAKLSFPYLDDRLYIAGFADHTFNQDLPPDLPAAPLVMEIQAGVRLVDQLHAVAEYRLNDYRASAPTNYALGAEYVVSWKP